MHVSSFGLLAVLSASLSAALPTELTNFLLVTTAQSESNNDSSKLIGVNVTSLFDPNHQSALYLRPIGPGYNSLPNFTFTSGTLSTITTAPHGQGIVEYTSKKVLKGEKLQFLASKQQQGNLALDDGYLLTVDGNKYGWMICSGDMGAKMLFWDNGENGVGCEKTYIQAVTKAPY